MSWSHLKMYEQLIKGDLYEIHRYFIPHVIEKQLKFLKKYFRVADMENTPHAYKRRKSHIEFVETAVMILGRLDMLCRLGIPIVAGSAYLDKSPWAVFGKVPEINPKFSFRNFDDIANHYRKLITKGCANAEYFHFRVIPTLPWELADVHHETPSFVVSLGICLLCDILLNCGPGCDELHDLFNNDLRIKPHPIDLSGWQDLRCKIMGRHGKINNKPHGYTVGQIYEPIMPLVSTTKIEEISQSDDLALGEKVLRYTPTIINDDHHDDGSVALETDKDYAARVQKSAAKYSYLGLSIDRLKVDEYGIPF